MNHIGLPRPARVAPAAFCPTALSGRGAICRFASRLLALAALAPVVFAAAQDVPTAHNDIARDGVQAAETILAPTNVNVSDFGKLFSFPVIGDVYAQPLYLHGFKMGDGKVHNVLLVATAQDYVYAFDADGDNPASGYLWRRSLLGSGETWVSNNDVNTTDIAPNIGVTGTPVADRACGTLYVVAKSKTTNGSTFIQRLHALDIATGAEKLHGPTKIQATVPGSGDGGTTVSFSPLLNNQRPALLLAPTPGASTASSVFIAWSSHGDNGAYHGWVIAYDAADISRQTGAWADTPNATQGGIWMSGGGLSSDGEGNIFAAGGNGTFDADVDGPDFGDSAFRLTLTKSGLAPRDSFTPADQLSLSQNDNDMGTSALLLLPTQSGPTPHLMVTTDKSGAAYLLNRDRMGDYTEPNNSSLETFQVGFAVHGSFAFFDNRLYLAGDGGPIEAWKFDPKTERFATTPESRSHATFGIPFNDGGSATPSVSANGTKNGVLWALDNSQFGSGPAVLRAYDPANLAVEYYDSTQAANNGDAPANAVKFTTATIAGGKIYVGGSNAVTIYGLRAKSGVPTEEPTFKPGAGTYTTAQTVAISSATADASIYYTTDGSAPSTGSTLYTGPISVASSETLRAVAIAPAHPESASALADYTITVGTSGSGAVPFGNGFPAASMLLNGSAQLAGSRLRLTDGNSGEAGSAYYPSKVNVKKFTNDFDFQLANAAADGFTFVIQNASKTALGTLGGGLGYGPDQSSNFNNGTIGSSVAIKFDIYDNEGEGFDSTGLYQDGASPELPAIDLSGTGVNLSNGNTFHAHMAYDGTVLKVAITDKVTKASASQTYTVDIPTIVGKDTAYVGFTGGSGGLTAIQDIVDWVFAVNK